MSAPDQYPENYPAPTPAESDPYEAGMQLAEFGALDEAQALWRAAAEAGDNTGQCLRPQPDGGPAAQGFPAAPQRPHLIVHAVRSRYPLLRRSTVVNATAPTFPPAKKVGAAEFTTPTDVATSLSGPMCAVFVMRADRAARVAPRGGRANLPRRPSAGRLWPHPMTPG